MFTCLNFVSVSITSLLNKYLFRFQDCPVPSKYGNLYILLIAKVIGVTENQCNKKSHQSGGGGGEEAGTQKETR